MAALQFDQVITAVIFVGVRVGGVMMFPPFLGSSGIPLQMKAGLTLALTALLFPVAGVVAISSDVMGWVRVAGNEMVIGLMLGLAMQLVFEAAQFAGAIVGVQTGFSLITLLDPQTQGGHAGDVHLSAADCAHYFFSIERASLAVARFGGKLQLSATRRFVDS